MSKVTDFERFIGLDGLNESSSMRNEGDEDDDEDEDVDFNPFLKGTPSPEASSSLSSDIEEVELDGDIIDSLQNIDDIDIPVRRVSEVEGYAGGDSDQGEEEIVMQTSVSPEGANAKELEKSRKRKLEESISDCELNVEMAGERENGLTSGVDANDGFVGGPGDKIIPINSDDEDAICRRTRARYSLASFTLDELEAFLQETDDEDDQNVDDQEEYRKFLAAVLLGKEGDGLPTEGAETVDDDDEDNDADFEIELEELLESDIDDGVAIGTQNKEFERAGRRPETRQNRRQKASNHSKTKLLEHAKKPLRPLIPISPHKLVSPMPMVAEKFPSFSTPARQDGLINGFTPHQIVQLHRLIHEHVQLLIQMYSLCVFDSSRQHIASQVEGLIIEMLHKRNQVMACRTEPYPSVCFRPPYACSSVPHYSPWFCSSQSFSETSTAVRPRACSLPNIQVPDFQGQMGSVQSIEGTLWMPHINGPLLSVLDVAPLGLVGRYMDDVHTAVAESRRRLMDFGSDANFEKEPLFPNPRLPSSVDPNHEVAGGVPSQANMTSKQRPPKKTMAATLVEKTKQQSIALVPKQIANLAQMFLSFFNPALFPHKPPPPSVANRVLFTDSEDELLALGYMEYNSNWKPIQQRFLPCKSKHQIFVRWKNRCSSKAPENPIKAVRRMKTSPLTPEETEAIQEGLGIYKRDWMSVWKFIVPHRDPSLLTRQWRVALGTQKSYRQDATKKEKRRMYLLKKKSLTSDLENQQLASDKEDDLRESNDKNDSGDDNIGNPDNAFVHEAFLSDWRPGTSYLIPSKRSCANLRTANTNEREQPSYGSAAPQLFSAQTHENACVLPHFQHLNTSPHLSHVNQSVMNTLQPNHPVYNAMLTRSNTKVPVWPSQACARVKNPHLVRLAPDLPPVNLPPSVRVIPHSAFKSNLKGASNKLKACMGNTGNGNSIPQVPAANDGSTMMKSGKDRSNQEKEDAATSKAEGSQVIKDNSVVQERATDSDLHLHPLLFQAPEYGHLPYYSLNCCSGASSSFSFFSGNQPQLNLSLFHNPHQAHFVVDKFNKTVKTKESTSSQHGIDFHPLLQRTDNATGESGIECSNAQSPVRLDSHPAQLHDPCTVMQSKIVSDHDPASPNNKGDELDLEIHLSSSRMNKIVERRDMSSLHASSIMNVPSYANVTEMQDTSAPCHKPDRNSSKVCEKVDSGSHSFVEPRNDISRCNVDDTAEQSNPGIVMEQEELSDSDEEEIEENVEFECEEMTDSEGEEGLGCEQLTEMHHNKEGASSNSDKASTPPDSENQHGMRTHSCPQTDVARSQNGHDPSRKLAVSLGKDNYSSWLSLNSSAPASSLFPKTKYVTSGGHTAQNSPSRPSRSSKKTTAQKKVTEQKNVGVEQRLSLGPLSVSTVRKPRKRASGGNASMNNGPESESAKCDSRD